MRALLLGAAAFLLLAAPAQGQVIATVDGAGDVTRPQFDHWMVIAATSAAGPDARNVRVPRRGTPRYRDLRGQVMQLLIQELWVKGEAAERGIVVTDEQVREEFLAQKRRSFPRPGDFGRFLRQSRFTVADILFRVRLELASSAVREQVAHAAPPVSDAEVREEYDADPGRYAVPERRDVRVRIAPTRAAARRAVGSGRLLTYVKRGQLPRAVFRARRGVVRYRDGWLAFRVVRVHPRRQRPFDEVAARIRRFLRAERRQEAVDEFVEEFPERWRERTSCRARYSTADCGRTIP